MRKSKAVSAILFHVVVFSAAVLGQTEESIEKVTKLKAMNCSSFQTKSRYWDLFKLDAVEDARPAGHKVYFQFSAVVNKTASTLFSSTSNQATASFYAFELSAVKNEEGIWFYRNNERIGNGTFPPSEIVDVVFAITDDDTVTLTVDGRKILTYNEISPFAINHFGFCVSRKGDEARFFYNCKAKQDMKGLTKKNPEPTTEIQQLREPQQIISSSTEDTQQTMITSELSTEMVKQLQESSDLMTQLQQKTTSQDPVVTGLIEKLELQRKEITKLNADLQQVSANISAMIKGLFIELQKQRKEIPQPITAGLEKKTSKDEEKAESVTKLDKQYHLNTHLVAKSHDQGEITLSHSLPLKSLEIKAKFKFEDDRK